MLGTWDMLGLETGLGIYCGFKSRILRAKARHWKESRHSSAKFIALDGNLCSLSSGQTWTVPGFSPEREEPARFRRERGYAAGLWKSLYSQQLQRELAREQAESEEGHGVSRTDLV